MRANLSKKLLTVCLLTMQLSIFSTAFAKSGGAIAGGGGSNLKSDFRKRTESLISRLNGMNDSLASSYAKAFQRTIDDPAFKIDVVEVLIDPMTGKSVANQRPLYAYGVKNYIQLKSTPSEDEGAESWEKKFRAGGNLDPDVFHEMAWAAIGNDADRDYQISIGKLKLQQNKGVQKSRYKLLKADTFYYNRGSTVSSSGACIYHFEVDEENQSFVMTGVAPGRMIQLDDCSTVYQFQYDEQKDLWSASYKEPLADNGEVSLKILPDGNLLINVIADIKGTSDLKFVALGSNESYNLEGSSGQIGGACVALEFDTNERVLAILNEQAIRQGKQSCERLFKNCKMTDIYSKQQSKGGPVLSCSRIAVFQGSHPRL